MYEALSAQARGLAFTMEKGCSRMTDALAALVHASR